MPLVIHSPQPMLALRLCSFVKGLSNSDVFHIFPENSLISGCSPWRLIKYKFLINVLSPSEKNILTTLQFSGLQENSLLMLMLITNSAESLYSKLVEEVAINKFSLNLQNLLHAMSGLYQVTFQQDCHTAHGIFLTLILPVLPRF